MVLKLSRTLRIRKRPAPAVMTLGVLLLPLFWGTLFDLLSLPGTVKYVADAIWVLLLVLMSFRGVKGSRTVVSFAVFTILFFLYCLIVYAFKYQSVFYFLWGMRNNFRFYVYFFAVISYLSANDVDTVYKFLDVLFWVNAAVSLLQFFVLGYKQDYLGGIFGVSTGCNGMTIIFFAIVLSRSLLSFMAKKEAFWLSFSKCAVALLVAALAELKFFFVLFVIILGMAMLITVFSWRKLLVFVLCVALVLIGSSILVSIFDFEGFLSFDGVWELATQEHYSSDRTVNRLSAVPTIARSVLSDPLDRVFGLGLGNCDTSSFDICNTPFYRTHAYLRYSYFSSAFLFLELGYIGLVIYFGFFGMCFVQCRKRLKNGEGDMLNTQAALIMSIVSVILIFYNSSMRTEVGYMVYFVLALPFISSKSELEEAKLR